MRIGHGFDVHKFGADRPLLLAGIEVPHTSGLVAHSDGDIVAHAVADALLGAAALGDIGQHFPDTDDQFKNISGEQILNVVLTKINEQGFKINNIDVTVMAQKPRLAPYMLDMRKKLSNFLSIELNQVNIKATTTEKLGFIGRTEGMAVEAVCLLL